MEDAKTSVSHAVLSRSLAVAEQSRRAIAPVRAQLGDDLDAAYAVQAHTIRALESLTNPRVGRKVGLTSPAVQQQLGVDQPDFGVLLRHMEVADGGTLERDELIAPKAEAEVAFVLRHDVLSADAAAVREAVAYAVAAIEIVDSRIENWDISITDTVADNASSARYVLGAERVTLDLFEPREVTMTLRVDGAVVSQGSGEACLGDPLHALQWVAETALRLGDPLRAGEVVLSGALGPMVQLEAGQLVEAELGVLGSVKFRMSDPQTREGGVNDA